MGQLERSVLGAAGPLVCKLRDISTEVARLGSFEAVGFDVTEGLIPIVLEYMVAFDLWNRSEKVNA